MICFETTIGGLPITLSQTRKKFTVTYWKQVKKDLDYTQAALELGACIMHAAACNGDLNND